MKPRTVEDYLASVPDDARMTLERVRSTVKKVVPDATERLSYGMPTFFLDRALVAYAAFTRHCSFFPYSSSTLRSFTKELSSYETSVGTIRFPIGKPLPASLIKKIVRARIAENKLRKEKRNSAESHKKKRRATRA